MSLEWNHRRDGSNIRVDSLVAEFGELRIIDWQLDDIVFDGKQQSFELRVRNDRSIGL